MSHLNRIVLLLVLVSAVATRTLAQAPAAKPDVVPFLGTWTLTLDTPQGQTPVTLTLKDTNGAVSGEIGSDVVAPQTITDISRVDGNLVLKYNRDMAGTAIPVKVTLKPADGRMMFEFNMADGQVVLEGVADKKSVSR